MEALPRDQTVTRCQILGCLPTDRPPRYGSDRVSALVTDRVPLAMVCPVTDDPEPKPGAGR